MGILTAVRYLCTTRMPGCPGTGMSQRQSGLSYRCWDLSLGPLEEHIVLLTGEQFVHPSKINLKKKPNRLHKGGLSEWPGGYRRQLPSLVTYLSKGLRTRRWKGAQAPQSCICNAHTCACAQTHVHRIVFPMEGPVEMALPQDLSLVASTQVQQLTTASRRPHALFWPLSR